MGDMLQFKKIDGSSHIAEYAYNPDTQTMRIRFKTGKAYDYPRVTPEVFRVFEEAPSKGSYLSNVIKPGREEDVKLVDEGPRLPVTPKE